MSSQNSEVTFSVTTTENTVIEKAEAVSAADSEVTTAISATENAAMPAPTLAQRVVKIQFHLQNMAQSAIIIGQELIACKKEVGHGNWANWLKENFNLSERTARQFMQIYERFSANSKRQTSAVFDNLTYSQMAEMLALPKGEEENFIEQKAAEGNPIEEMTVKQLRAEIKDWKDKADREKKYAEDLKHRLNSRNAQYEDMVHTYTENYIALRERTDAERDALQKQIAELQNNPVEIVRTEHIIPPGYVETVQRAEELQEQVDQLLEQNEDLQNQVIEAVSKQTDPQIEFVTPPDYDEIKEQLAILQAEKDTLEIDAAFIQALNQFFMAANFLHQHKDRAEHNLKNFF